MLTNNSISHIQVDQDQKNLDPESPTDMGSNKWKNHLTLLSHLEIRGH